MDEVREEAAAFEGPDALFAGLGRFRKLGDAGPAYEIVRVEGDHVRIRLLESQEEADYLLDHALRDPLA